MIKFFYFTLHSTKVEPQVAKHIINRFCWHFLSRSAILFVIKHCLVVYKCASNTNYSPQICSLLLSNSLYSRMDFTLHFLVAYSITTSDCNACGETLILNIGSCLFLVWVVLLAMLYSTISTSILQVFLNIRLRSSSIPLFVIDEGAEKLPAFTPREAIIALKAS